MPSLAGDRWRWNRRRGAAGQPAPLVPSPPNGRGRWYVSNPAMRHRPPRLPPLPRLSPPPRSPSHGPPLRPPHLGWGHPPRRHGGLPVRSPRPSAGSQGSDWGHRSGVTFCSAAASPATTPTTAPPPRSCARRRRPPGRDLPRRDRSAGPAADRASRASPRRGKRVPRLRRREGQRASLEGRLARRRGDAEGGGTGKTASPATRPTTVHAGKAGHTRRDEETEGGRRWGALRVKLPTHRRRGAHTKARRDGGTKRRRGEALGCTPCEAAHPFLPSTAYLPGRPPYLTPLKGEAPRTPVPGVRSCDPAGSRGACAQRGVARLYSRGSKRTSRSARVSWWPPSGVAVRTSVARCCLRAWSWRMRSSTVWRVMRL